MRLGMMLNEGGTINETVQQAADLETAGFDSAWFLQIFEWDALTAIALAGARTSRIELGASVIPVYTRHPFAMAQQALTVQAAASGRFTLGLGLSHKPLVEGMWGLSYDRPARYMREYLSVLLPLVRDGRVAYSGEVFRTNAALRPPGDARPVPVLLAALAPRMLRIAGEHTDGTITWMTGLRTLATHTIPRITAAARNAGRPAPRVVVALPVAVTDDPAAAREAAAKFFAVYGGLANYRRMMDMEGVAGPGDLAIAGDEAMVERQLRDLASAGVTDFFTQLLPARGASDDTRQRTTALLASLVGRIP